MNTKSEEVIRCPWLDTSKPDYVLYHDTEWGVPVFDDQVLFEFLTLEAAQAGLSWYTILKKRESYRRAFAEFDPEKVACFDEARIEILMLDPGIVRNRLKLQAAVNNARRFIEVQTNVGSFSAYLWSFVEGKPKLNTLHRLEDYPATSRESDALSKDLRKRGFKFLGSTTCYAFMQATGMVNDHGMHCFRRRQLMRLHTP